MSDPFYVHNTSNLQLMRLIRREKGGLADLMPGEVGELDQSVIDQPRVQQWLRQGRLVRVGKDQFDQTFYNEKNKFSESNTTYKAKAEVADDGSTIIVPGVDELPEIEEIPEPIVENLEDNSVAARAPEGDEPLTDDTVEYTGRDLRPMLLNEDGTLTDLEDAQQERKQEPVKHPLDFNHYTPSEMQKALDEQSEETPSVEQEPVEEVLTEEEVDPFYNEPEVETIDEEELPQVANHQVQKETSSEQELSEQTEDSPSEIKEILKLKSWRQQVKRIEQIEDSAVIATIRDQTHRKAVQKACDSRIEQLNSKS